ncbi:MAG TPA: GNAT family N-acetyltransferase [Gammaproteobacteria bacterium]|nr:GNAT family N-acetyltransferase [Gammaproteobacteria bacterium]
MFPVEYHAGLAEKWDAFLGETPAGTFLHSRKFLAYHGNRFTDRSVVLLDAGERILAVFPAAEDGERPGLIVSHPGSTYGGMIWRQGTGGEVLVDALTEIVRYYSACGYQELRYKAVPYIYRQAPCDDDLYALFRLGADRYRCDLSACIDLERRGRVSGQRKRGARKAATHHVRISTAVELVPEFWAVLEQNLRTVHGRSPVHSVDEIQLLYSYFRENIRFVMAQHEGRVIAGVVLFIIGSTVHAQYIASSEQGRSLGALDYLFEHCIQEYSAGGARYFDFGTCNEGEGKILNSGLYNFKQGFGAGGVVHEFYSIDFKRMSL